MEYLTSVIRIFRQYKTLSEKAMEQVSENGLFTTPGKDQNSIAIIVQHMSGNMLSRWTDFLTTDGEKPWRNRDVEFEDVLKNRQEVLECWEKGWKVFLDTLDSLTEDDLGRTVTIRNEPHTVLEAINRQMAHYAYHTGQIVQLCRMYSEGNWQSLSIPRGKSAAFNAEKMK